MRFLSIHQGRFTRQPHKQNVVVDYVAKVARTILFTAQKCQELVMRFKGHAFDRECTDDRISTIFRRQFVMAMLDIQFAKLTPAIKTVSENLSGPQKQLDIPSHLRIRSNQPLKVGDLVENARIANAQLLVTVANLLRIWEDEAMAPCSCKRTHLCHLQNHRRFLTLYFVTIKWHPCTDQTALQVSAVRRQEPSPSLEEKYTAMCLILPVSTLFS